MDALPPHPPLRHYYSKASQKPSFVRRLFDETADDYDRIERRMAMGSGSWYRRRALRRSGLQPGMSVLDVAMGTGLVTREAIRIVGDPCLVLGLDPSGGMLREGMRLLNVPAVRGLAEQLPLDAHSFDFLSMGYALRHLSDLTVTFREFHRVLKPGGKLCVLEITRPQNPVGVGLLKLYMKTLVPMLTRLQSGHAQTQLLWRYYWETIEACVEPETVLQALRQAGFQQVKRFVELGIFSEYTGIKPA